MAAKRSPFADGYSVQKLKNQRRREPDRWLVCWPRHIPNCQHYRQPPPPLQTRGLVQLRLAP